MAQAWVPAVVIVAIALINILIYVLNENSWVWKRCFGSRRGPAVYSHRAPGVSRAQKPQQRFAWDLIAVSDLYDGFIGTLGLALFRLFCFAVFCFTIIYGRIRAGPDNGMMVFFTNWTYVLWAFTSIYGAALTLQVWHHKRRPQQYITNAADGVKQTEWAFKHKLHLVLLVTVAASSIMLTAFYWGVLYNRKPVDFDNPWRHGASTFLLLLELLLSRAPLVSYHVQAPVAYATLYAIFMWIYHAATGIWAYSTLDWSRAISIPYYAAIPLLIILAFVVMFAVVAVREVIYRGKCSCCKSRSDRSGPTAEVQLPHDEDAAPAKYTV